MTVLTRPKPCSGAKNAEAQRGFTMPDLVVVLSTMGVLFGPVLAVFDDSMEATHDEFTQISLDAARTALITFSAANNGCLPFTADWEGGLPDTDQNGASGYTDTGVGKANARAGDLPWADLGLGKHFVDGGGLRIQYYVASPYTDADNDPSNGYSCAAGARGVEWNPRVTYDGTVDPQYLYYTPPGGDRGLYKITGVLPAGTPPASGDNVADPLPIALLELRRGPDVKANGSQNDVLSAQNAFVLLATGKNINPNASINLPYMRDEDHASNSGGAPWNLNQNDVDDERFSATRSVHASDQGKDGDDTLLVVSFLNFKAALEGYGIHMEPICETAC